MKAHVWHTDHKGRSVVVPKYDRIRTPWVWLCDRCGLMVPNVYSSPEKSLSVLPRWSADCDENLVQSVLDS